MMPPCLTPVGRSSNAKSNVTSLKAPESADIFTAARILDSKRDMKVTSFPRDLGRCFRICTYCNQLHYFVTIGNCFQRDYVKEDVSWRSQHAHAYIDMCTGLHTIQAHAWALLISNTRTRMEQHQNNADHLQRLTLVASKAACDDGNSADNDGCNSTCSVKHGWVCNNTECGESSCSAPCGNGLKSSNESCDDGDSQSNVECSSECAVGFGFDRGIGQLSVCTSSCGHGNHVERLDEGDEERTFECVSDDPECSYFQGHGDHLEGPDRQDLCKAKACDIITMGQMEGNAWMLTDASKKRMHVCDVAPSTPNTSFHHHTRFRV